MNEIHLPTIGGSLRVLSLDDSPIILRYRGLLNQSDASAPVPVADTEINEIGLTGFSYLDVGIFGISLAPPYSIAAILNYSLYPTIQPTFGGDLMATQYLPQTDVSSAIGTSLILSQAIDTPTVAQPANGGLINSLLSIDIMKTPVSTDSNSSFNTVLSKLDVNQLALWIKIVIRYNGTVTEVDGKKYRKTLDFESSSRVINS